jgi:hypothetical protein
VCLDQSAYSRLASELGFSMLPPDRSGPHGRPNALAGLRRAVAQIIERACRPGVRSGCGQLHAHAPFGSPQERDNPPTVVCIQATARLSGFTGVYQIDG